MKNLKIGDIKKFHYVQGNRDFVGVVVNIDKYYVYTINTGGKESRWEFGRNELTYTATRLEPKIREDLMRIADTKKNINKMTSDIEKLKSFREREQERLQKNIATMLHHFGNLTVQELPEVFKDLLSKSHANLCHDLFNNYEVDCYDSPVGVWLSFGRYEFFAKWVSENDYDFLRTEYDGNMFINGRTNQYNELCKKYSRNDIKFTMSDLSGKFEDKHEIQVGDKGSLCYHHKISINIPKDCVTKAYLSKLIKTIKYNG